MHPFSCRTAIITKHNTETTYENLQNPQPALIFSCWWFWPHHKYRWLQTIFPLKPQTSINQSRLHSMWLHPNDPMLVKHPSMIVRLAQKSGATDPSSRFVSGDLAKHWKMMISHMFTMGIHGFLMDLATSQMCLTSHGCFPLQRHDGLTTTAGANDANERSEGVRPGETLRATRFSDGAKCWGSTDI